MFYFSSFDESWKTGDEDGEGGEGDVAPTGGSGTTVGDSSTLVRYE